MRVSGKVSERGWDKGRTEELGREHGAFELALHESDGPLQGFGDIVRSFHNCIFTTE